MSALPDTTAVQLRAAVEAIARRGTLEAALAALGPSSDAVRATVARWDQEGHPPLTSPAEPAWGALARLGLGDADPRLDVLRRLLDGTSADPAALEHALAAVAAESRQGAGPAVEGMVATSLLAAVEECWRSVVACYRRLHPALRDGDRDRAELLLRAHARVVVGLVERVELLAGRAAGDPRPARPRGLPAAPAAPVAAETAPPPTSPPPDDARPRRPVLRVVLVTGVAAAVSAVLALLISSGGLPLP